LLRNKNQRPDKGKFNLHQNINELGKNGDFAQRQNKTLTIPKLLLKFCFNDSTDRDCLSDMPG